MATEGNIRNSSCYLFMDSVSIIYDGWRHSGFTMEKGYRSICMNPGILLLHGYCSISAFYIFGIIFVAGFRHLIRQVRTDYEWIGTLTFGTFIIWIGVTLMADGQLE